MAILLGLVRCIDRLNEWVGKLAGVISLLMVVVVTGDVIMRYAFDTTFVAVQELEWHLFGVMFLLGAGYTLLKDEHVRVDVFYQRLNRKAKAWINFLGVLFFLLPGCYLVLDTSWKFFSMSLAIHEGSGDPGGLPARYVLKAFILIGFALVALQGVSMGIKAFMEIIGKPIQPAPGTTEKPVSPEGEGA
ncbi:Tripartite ATP-independent periplasmic transporter DctQ component [Pseudodesulfovibrio mercurii]|uniref:Tripartite ATP-independent periplasmic transporter DctQ component n=1 Tax=Pseudodesulfovibrio mercurii TaxID=641491 RepID=F0JIT1_9BACT|nr:TRAP transporter small permease subunit [Pseudodesulfovibrio mercurii]EGB15830.1 Tripartite ATP-independent periplasmic transporter DctQ component [Pseudodesulfovibrio mercurii]